MKNYSIVFFALLFQLSLQAQVGINTTNPSSTLDIVSSNEASPSPEDGILIPRVESFTTTNPGANQDGMLVFLNTASAGDARGFYYWDDALDRWIGIGGGEWRDGVNSAGDDLIFAIQAKTAGHDIVITDNGANGPSIGIGTDDPVERFELRGDGDNDIQLTSANSNPPNYVVYNTGGTVDNPSVLPADREIGAFVAKSFDGNNVRETGGVRFYADEVSSGGRLPTRFEVTLGDRNQSFGSNQVQRLIIKPNGNTGLSVPDPTAILHLRQGETNAESAPLKFNQGNLMNNPERGALEYDGQHLYITDNTATRREIATVGGSGSFQNTINFGDIPANGVSETSVTVPGLNANTMSCNCTPKYFVPVNIMWSCYVQSNNTVRVRVLNTSSVIKSGVNFQMAITPILQN